MSNATLLGVANMVAFSPPTLNRARKVYLALSVLAAPWPTRAASEAVVYSFKGGSDGANPSASLVSMGGILYGTTRYGGSGFGTVFSINPATGAEAVAYSFTGGSDGGTPLAELINVGGALYGTTAAGGKFGKGAVYSVDPATGAEAVVHSFAGRADGAGPTAALINVSGLLYGTTSIGGASSKGTVFAVTPTTGAITVLHSFAGGADGADPNAALIEAGSTIYGTQAWVDSVRFAAMPAVARYSA